jgi:type IV fimbrial biogenesis protein FimT
MPRSSRAFTLIELCAVALLLAIAAAIGLPAFGQLLGRVQLEKASDALADDMASARRAAIDRGRPVAICPSHDGRHCGPGSHWHHGWIILDGTRVLSTHDGLPGRLSAAASRAVSGMHFDAAGRATANNGTITLCVRNHPETAVAVVVSMAGRIHREAPDHAKSVACAGSREDDR